MIVSFFQELGAWAWWVLALLLLGLEILAPGTFFLWFAFAAFVVGAVSLTVGADAAFWTWQLQAIAFVLLALLFAVVGRRFVSREKPATGEAQDLNRRAAQLVGRTGTISEAIVGGEGRAKVGETTWKVSGPDLPVGAHVRVTGERGGLLVVEAAG
jgi:membrane protein implicated in regulation of membrane protease activity